MKQACPLDVLQLKSPCTQLSKNSGVPTSTYAALHQFWSSGTGSYQVHGTLLCLCADNSFPHQCCSQLYEVPRKALQACAGPRSPMGAGLNPLLHHGFLKPFWKCDLVSVTTPAQGTCGSPIFHASSRW